jgi:hypothetical protein
MTFQRTQSIQLSLVSSPLAQACPRTDFKQFAPRGTSLGGSCLSAMSNAQTEFRATAYAAWKIIKTETQCNLFSLQTRCCLHLDQRGISSSRRRGACKQRCWQSPCIAVLPDSKQLGKIIKVETQRNLVAEMRLCMVLKCTKNEARTLITSMRVVVRHMYPCAL